MVCEEILSPLKRHLSQPDISKKSKLFLLALLTLVSLQVKVYIRGLEVSAAFQRGVGRLDSCGKSITREKSAALLMNFCTSC